MRRTIERYSHESDLQLEERVNLTLMCDSARELILQRKFNDETAAWCYIMSYDDFKRVKIDKQFNVLVLSKDKCDIVTLNIKISCEQWKALYEAYSTVNEWSVDIDNNCYLLDDYSKNLFEWNNCNGIGIKRLTSLADNSRKLWKGLAIKDLRELITLLS